MGNKEKFEPLGKFVLTLWTEWGLTKEMRSNLTRYIWVVMNIMHAQRLYNNGMKLE